MALANLIGTYTAGEDAVAQDINTDLNSLLTRVNSITTEQLAAGSVVESILAAASVSTAKIQDGALSADTTGRAKMADGFLTRVKLAADAKNSYYCVVDKKTANTDGGTGVSGSWQTRTLNTVWSNPDSLSISLSSNELTLPSGTWRIRAKAPAQASNAHQTRIYNVTDSTVQVTTSSESMYGLSSWAVGGTQVTTYAEVFGTFTLASSKAIRLEHRLGTTSGTPTLGDAVNFGSVEIYSVVELWKVA